MELVSVKEKYFSYMDYFILGPTVAKCPNSGDLLLNFDLFDGSDSNAGSVLFRSHDDGSSWKFQGFIEKSFVYDFSDSRVKNGYGALYTDESAGVMMYFANETYWQNNKIDSLWKMRKLYYRLSFDDGHSWTDKKYVIQKGDYDNVNFMKDVKFGKNMAATVSPLIVRAHDDSLLVSVQIQLVDDDGNLYNPTSMGYMKAGAVKGVWNKDKLEYEWDVGEYVTISPDKSMRGLYEPTFAIIGDSKVLMVMRNSNYTKHDEIIGAKYRSLSYDNGYTWTKPQILTYDDAQIMYSSSCIPKLLTHSKGDTYFIGVINDENPEGNLPRYPLCIAKVDTKRMCIIKDSVMVIDTKRSNHETAEKTRNVVDYSNHGVYEDKKTGNIVVLAPYRQDLTKYFCYLNRYEIKP